MAATRQTLVQQNRFFEKLELLRRVDSVIDLSRGWLQLYILMLVGENGAYVDEVVAALNVPRKAVLDSLRKMRVKGLVDINDGFIRLTEKGIEIYGILRSVAGTDSISSDMTTSRYNASSVYDVLSFVTRYVYLYDVIVALGSSPGYELPLEDLAAIARVGSRQLDEYLSVYTRREPRLLARVLRNSGWGPFRRTRVYYRLTRDGLKLLHRLPEYMRVRRSTAARILVSITRTLHPRLVLKRLMFITSLGSAIAMSIVVINPNAGVVVLGAWLVTLSFLAVLVSQSY
ncbi:hypothetical protein [Pyrodictium delaneyi]|uniref:Uncharacterized protein n=1 Tax=Pyrodictium delaneyi TaxID=1273541 RepID=A0A211YRW3_9CREN|nr:hypothetical protein [Pyrodictium delaneyi]OWJ55686.1 hypothetical protein Pdsh_02580 [Pyrodictium delaneyi]